MIQKQYGAITSDYQDDGGDTQNPGTIVFDEEQLHDTPETNCMAQLRIFCFQLLMPLKLPLIIILPLMIGIQFLSLSGNMTQTILWLFSLAAVMPVGVIFVEFVEDLVKRINSEALGAIIRVLAEHAAELLVSILTLRRPEEEMTLWVKPLLLGCILVSLLVTVGVGLLLLAVPSEGAYRLGTSVWCSFRPTLAFATVCFLLPTIHALTLKTNIKYKENIGATVVLSRCLALLAIGVYIFALITGLWYGRHLYESAVNANAPTSLTYALRYLRSGREDKDTCPIFEPRYSIIFAFIGASLSFTLLCNICYIIANNTLHASYMLPLSLPFITVILLPLLLRSASVGGAACMSAAGRLDIATCMGLSSALRIYSGVIPLIVLFAWGLGRTLDLVFDAFIASICFLSITIMSHVFTEGPAQRVDGAVLLAFYALIACACFLGDGNSNSYSSISNDI